MNQDDLIKKCFIALALIIGLLESSFAVTYKSNDYYNSVFLGEKESPIYNGPLNPKIEFNEHQAQLKFVDDIYYNSFFFDYIQNEIKGWEQMWFNELPAMSSCPNFFLNQNIEYIRYLYRLISISYLFESLKQHASLAYKLGVSDSVCTLDWNEIFGSCKPQGQDMKNFVRRAKYRYLINYDQGSKGRFTKEQVGNWLSQRDKSMTSSPENIIQFRMQHYCLSNNCDNFDLKGTKKAFSWTCSKDRELIQMFCSEKDKIYGLSESEVPRELLVKSNVMRVINEGGYASSCLKRYAKLFSNKETRYPWLVSTFPYIMRDLKKRDNKYLQGDMFLPGALKEFDKRGLTQFLFVAPTAKPTPSPIPTAIPTAVATAAAKPTPVPTVKPTPTPRPTPVPTAKPVIKLSQFEKALKNLRDNDLESSDVNMELFSKEFKFSDEVLAAIDGPLNDFQTFDALTDMKQYDKLGSKAQPVRLLFLKLLIERDSHTGLWNIVNVLGEKFFVINDLNKKNEPILIKLHNKASTNNKWQITILKSKQ